MEKPDINEIFHYNHNRKEILDKYKIKGVCYTNKSTRNKFNNYQLNIYQNKLELVLTKDNQEQIYELDINSETLWVNGKNPVAKEKKNFTEMFNQIMKDFKNNKCKARNL
jgi:hypothetical protein